MKDLSTKPTTTERTLVLILSALSLLLGLGFIVAWAHSIWGIPGMLFMLAIVFFLAAALFLSLAGAMARSLGIGGARAHPGESANRPKVSP